MTSTIDRLRHVATLCHHGGPLPRDLADWLGCGINRFLARKSKDLDGALGIVQAQGGLPWWREDAIRQRDAALRQLWQQTCPLDSVTARARKIAAMLRRYGASAWRIDRERAAMPPNYAGTAHEFLWRAFRTGAAMPLGERQLRTILGD